MERFYSQVGQDKWVVEFFQYKKNGFFVDIGAFDGIQISNSYYLEKKLDWSGICVEADPEVYKKLLNNRKCRCLHYAVWDVDGNVNYTPNGVGGFVSNVGNIKVPSRTLRSIFREYNVPQTIDYISIDVEGAESKCLQQFPFDTHEFQIMTIEHNLYLGDSSNKDQIYEILSKNGYIVYKENVEHNGYKFEDWYINSKLIEI